jgi:hypothetical protein
MSFDKKDREFYSNISLGGGYYVLGISLNERKRISINWFRNKKSFTEIPIAEKCS